MSRELVQQRGQQRPITCVKPQPLFAELALQHRDLVSQGKDLNVLATVARRQQPEHRERVRHSEVRQPQQHGSPSCRSDHPAAWEPSPPRTGAEIPQPGTPAPTGVDEGFGRRRVLDGFIVDGEWWRAMGVREGDSIEDGLMRAGVPQKAATLVDELLRTAVIRFDLESINLEEMRPAASVARTFHRTLMVQELMEDLIRVAGTLPDVFAPFRQALTDQESRRDGLVPLLTLPPTSHVPVALQWLARARTDAEIEADLAAAFQRYEGPGTKLVEMIGQRLLFRQLDEEPDHVVMNALEVGIEKELKLTAPTVELRGDNNNEFTATKQLHPAWALNIVGETGTALVLDGLSAGERRWADEAISTGIRAVDDKVLLTRILISVLDQLDEYSCMEVGLTIAEDVDEAIEGGGVWLPFVLDGLLESAGKALGSATSLNGPRRLASELAVYSIGANKLVVRVFDEPEAHLHPAAQRRLVTALDKLGCEDTNIVISSHSSLFLGMPGYAQAHVDNSEGLSRIDVLGSGDVEARDALAQQLGITTAVSRS